MAAVRHLGFVESRGTIHEGPFVVPAACKNLVMIGFQVIA